MANQQRVWMRVRRLSREERDDIAAACRRFIDERLKPRFLGEIRPTEFNYPVDLHGRWRGRSYSFLTRYRSGFAENLGAEFDAPFARLDHVEEKLDRLLFDVMWPRHSGRFWPLRSDMTLEEAFAIIEKEGLLWPT
ncbi:MAG: hypothetical protein ABSA66_06525 [Roseiarcus sp.]|jgi:hypothetical protein